MPDKNEFKVNDYLTVKLGKRFAEIYIRNKKVLSCSHVVFDVPRSTHDNITDYSSIDEYQDSHEYYSGIFKVTEKEIYWATCSNLQAWAENNYDTNILSKECSFRLLEELMEAGDETAKKVFVKEIIKRFNSGYLPVQEFIANSRFSKYLPKDSWELKLKVLEFKQISDFNENSFRFDRKKIYKFENNELRGLGYKDHFFRGGSFPFSLEGFTQLEYLYFINTTLSYIPDSIDNCRKLKELILVGEGNQYSSRGLREFKDNIKNLKNLEKLVISNNFKIETIPSSIGNLEILRNLDLGSNSFKTLPVSIGNLSNLETLNLKNNKLYSIPDSIGNLKSLKYLDLSNNNLESIPASIGNLENLEFLNLSNNNLSKISESVNKLTSLKYLYLSKNPIRDLPKSLINTKCNIVLIGAPMSFASTRIFNDSNKFLKNIIDLLDDALSMEVVITEDLVIEMIDCLKDYELYRFLMEKKENFHDILIRSLINELIHNKVFRHRILSELNNRLNYKIESDNIARFFELIFEYEENTQLIKELVFIEPEFYEIFYKILTELEHTYEIWEDYYIAKFRFMSPFVKEKLISIINHNQFDDFLKMNYVHLLEVLEQEDLKYIILDKSSELLEFILKNALLFQNSLYDKYNLFDREFSSINFPYPYHDPVLKEALSKHTKEIIERMNEKEISILIKLDLDYYLLKEDLTKINIQALYMYFDNLYKISKEYDSGENWLIDKFQDFTRGNFQPNLNIISSYLKQKIKKIVENRNLVLFQDLGYYYDLVDYLSEEDCEYLLRNTQFIEFIIENLSYYENEWCFVKYIERILSKVSPETKHIVTVTVKKLIMNDRKNEIETIIMLDLLDLFKKEELELLFLASKNLFQIFFINDYYDENSLRNKLETLRKRYEPYLIPVKKDIMYEILQENNLKDIFQMFWHKWWLDSLTTEEFIDLISNPKTNLLEKLLRAVHYEGFKKKYDHTCAEFPLLPDRFLREAREPLKHQILRIIKTKKMDTFVPILGIGMLDLLNINEIKTIFNDPNYNLFENLKFALENHDSELYYFQESFDRWLIKFARAMKDYEVDVDFDSIKFSLSLPTMIFGVEPYKDKWNVSDPDLSSQNVEIAGKKIPIYNNRLDLSNSYIQDLNNVADLFQIYDLKDLNVSSNNLDKIPNSIGNLVKLEKLNISQCGLINLPESIGSLKDLKELILSGNKLNSIPNSIKELKKLEILNLAYNNFDAVPESIRGLTSIKILNFHSNPIFALPYWFGELKELQSLDLVFTQLHRLPESIGELKSLKELNLSWSHIESLPNSIGDLKSLEYLDFSCTNIKSVPESLINCSALREVHYLDHEFKVLPEVLRRLSKRGVVIGDKYKR